MKYKLTKINAICHRISTGRDTVGWCHQWDSGMWEAKANGCRGTGRKAETAFNNLVVELKKMPPRRVPSGPVCRAPEKPERFERTEKQATLPKNFSATMASYSETVRKRREARNAVR